MKSGQGLCDFLPGLGAWMLLIPAFCFPEFREGVENRRKYAVFIASKYKIWHISDDIRNGCLCGNRKKTVELEWRRK